MTRNTSPDAAPPVGRTRNMIDKLTNAQMNDQPQGMEMMMKPSRTIALVLTAAIGTLACPASTAAETKTVDAAKKVLSKYQDAVVWITVTTKVRTMSGGRLIKAGKTRKVTAMGVVIDSSGLTVVSHSKINPAGAIYGMMPRGHSVTVKTEYLGMTIGLADGNDVPAKIVSTDSGTDLAFIKPDKKAKGAKPRTFTAVDLSEVTTPKLLDEIVVISRLNKSWDRQPTVWLTRISAILKKGKSTHYLAQPLEQGTPVFTADGKLLGLTVMITPGIARMARYYMVILPAKDVLAASRKKSPPTDKASKKTDKVKKD